MRRTRAASSESTAWRRATGENAWRVRGGWTGRRTERSGSARVQNAARCPRAELAYVEIVGGELRPEGGRAHRLDTNTGLDDGLIGQHFGVPLRVRREAAKRGPGHAAVPLFESLEVAGEEVQQLGVGPRRQVLLRHLYDVPE